MSYMDRLKAKISETRHPHQLPKLPKPGFDSFGSEPSREFSENSSLPPDVLDGLDRLRTMPPPRVTNPKVWPGIVRDCLALASNGRAHQALALGWSTIDLWGASRDGSFEGLGVWLDGRRILLLDATSCIVEAGPRSRAIYNRRPTDDAVPIWDLGRHCHE